MTPAPLGATLALLDPDTRAPVLAAELRRRVGVLLGVADPAEVPEDTPLVLLGLDSMQMISLRHGLEADVGVSLPPIGDFLVLPLEELIGLLLNGVGAESPSVPR
jgi:hypothetical protein